MGLGAGDPLEVRVQGQRDHVEDCGNGEAHPDGTPMPVSGAPEAAARIRWRRRAAGRMVHGGS